MLFDGSSSMRFAARAAAAFIALAVVCGTGAPAGAALRDGPRPHVTLSMKLPDGSTAAIYNDGIARITSKDGRGLAYQALAKQTVDPDFASENAPPDRFHILSQLVNGGATRQFSPNEVLVVFRDGVGSASDVTVVPRATLMRLRASKAGPAPSQVPQYTNDYRVNALLAKLGADRTERIFRGSAATALSGARTAAAINPVNAYRVHVSGATVAHAVAALAATPSVLFASPNWYVGSMSETPHILSPAVVAASAQRSFSMRRPAASFAATSGVTPSTSALPSNYALVSSGQSLWNTPSDDAAAAYDEIQRSFGQLPGQGQIITNVSLGDIDDAGAAADSNNPCHFYASAYGPTMHLIGNQHYMDWPSMPLIPAYVSDPTGALSGSADVCGIDPQLVEIGLDFSMMSPLPHQFQRPGEQGSGLTDLLGIAPGAQYRLVVPSATTIADVDAAFLAAALQSPRPTVITASLGFGFDSQGYASRYLEEDPLTEAVVSSIVHNYDVVVCISGGDGLRTATTAAIGPSGGSVPIDEIANGGVPTNLNDVGYSGTPSKVFDSGAIAVGGTTLDDLSAMPPQDRRYAAFAQWHAFAATRWTGATYYSSAFGSRMNVSAPGDNVTALIHTFGAAFDGVTPTLNGGTSASAPQVAAAAAVALQVARLTGHPFHSATDVRAFLESTATKIPPLPQADVDVHVGPQLDLTRAVETLLARGGKAAKSGVARVAIEQRRNDGSYDTLFTSDTDPTNISLQNAPVIAWITVAPDWENVPGDATYRLYVTGHRTKVLATTRWARLLPETILLAAGMPFVSSSSRTVNLTYEATGAGKAVSTNFSLTFGPAGEPLRAHAPLIPPVTTGTTIPITYDLDDVAGASSLILTVSQPGRVNAATGTLFHPAYTLNLRALKGTVEVPVAALQGGGIYGAAIQFTAGDGVIRSSDYAYTRVQVGSKARPAAPLLAYNGSTPGHFAEVPFGSSFQVTYDVRNVPGATGAMLEIAAAGPGTWKNQNAFNNPNGSQRDNNGVDTGSIYYAPLMGTSGTVTVNGRTAGLFPTLYHSIRVLPLKFGAVAGEAGDISTVQMDGVLAADGGAINQGWGVNANGLDGYLTSNQTTASGEPLGSVEVFDQASMGIAATIDSGTGNIYSTGGWGAWGGDIGLVGIQSAKGTFGYNLLNPISAGTLGAAWNPPFPSSYNLDEGALNNVDGTGAFLVTDLSHPNPDRFKVFTSNLAADTFSQAYDISGPLSGFTLPIIGGMAQDGNLKSTVVAFSDAFASNSCAAPTLVETDLVAGTSKALNALGQGSSNGVAIDSQSHKAGVLTSCDGGLGIYDLKAGTATESSLGQWGYTSLSPVADEKNGLFLAMQFVGNDWNVNNNALSQLDEVDESGNVLKTVEAFNTSGFYWIGTHYIQVNPNRRVLFFPGPGQQELEPFNY